MRQTNAPTETSHGLPSPEGLPTTAFDAVFHVGTMDRVNKRAVNLEGNGLSVSLHPNVWRYMDRGWVNGDLWKLTRSGNVFLDIRAISDEQRSRIVDWGIAEGYVTRSQYGLWGWDKLWREFPGLVSHQEQVMDFLTIFYARSTGRFDGVWWDNPVKVAAPRKGGSATKGTIFESHLPSWTILKVGEEQAPDRHLLTARGLPRKQAKANVERVRPDGETPPCEEKEGGESYGMRM